MSAREILLCTLLGCGGGTVPGVSDGGVVGDASAADRCRPGPSGPIWVVEGSPVNFDAACTTGWDPGAAEFSISPIPAGASFDAATRRFSWTPGLDQAAVYELEIAIADIGETGTVTIGVADDWDHPDNVPVVDPEKYPMELGLPVIFLAPEPISEDAFAPVTVVYRGKTLVGEGKRRGRSSSNYPKTSYALQFDRFNAISEPDFVDDFIDKQRIILTSTFDDNAYFRQRMAYDLWNRLDPTILVSAYNAVVYLDGEYWGLYTVTDHVYARLMKESGLSDNGNLYKAINHDANFRTVRNNGDAKATMHDGYEKVEGEPAEGQPGAFDDLEALVTLVATGSDDDFNQQIANLIDVDDYLAWYMLTTYISAQDSGGKNSYHYHDETRSWRVVPWDFNASFGQAWETTRLSPDEVEHFDWRNRLFERLRAHPTISVQLADRYSAALRGGVFDLAQTTALIDAYAVEIDDGARRDWARWEEAYRNYGGFPARNDINSYDGEVQYVRDWLTARWDVMTGIY